MTDTPDLIDTATRFLHALLDAADTDTIGVANWWDRAKTALETGAATGTTYAEVVSTAARKLQITWALPEAPSKSITEIGKTLADPDTFAAWRELCQRDAVYITAITRVQRTERRTKKTTKKTEQETLL